MKITQSNVRSIVLQALLLIFLVVLRAKADNYDKLERRNYFHNPPTLDPIPIQTLPNFKDHNDDDNDDDGSTTTTTTTTITEPTTTTTSTFTALASVVNDPKSTSTHSIPATPLPSANTTNQYTNTSDPLVQYDLECRADANFCNKVSEAVGAAIDEFTRVINVKNSLL
jgi:hypothetical protein